MSRNSPVSYFQTNRPGTYFTQVHKRSCECVTNTCTSIWLF